MSWEELTKEPFENLSSNLSLGTLVGNEQLKSFRIPVALEHGASFIA